MWLSGQGVLEILKRVLEPKMFENHWSTTYKILWSKLRFIILNVPILTGIMNLFLHVAPDLLLLSAVLERLHEVCVFLLVPGHHLLHFFDSIQCFSNLFIHQLLSLQRKTWQTSAQRYIPIIELCSYVIWENLSSLLMFDLQTLTFEGVSCYSGQCRVRGAVKDPQRSQ